MIKNIVFDLGNVLVKYDPDSFLLGYSDAEKELLGKESYYSENWLKMDHGDLTEAELTELVLDRIPSRYHSDAVRLIRWYDLSSPIDGMERLVIALKAAGYGVYLLSNTSEAFYRFRSKIPALKHFDGYLISADHHLLKPDIRIFRLLCEKFSLEPSECVFIDDIEANVNGAKVAGFEGIVFGGDVSALINQLGALGVGI